MTSNHLCHLNILIFYVYLYLRKSSIFYNLSPKIIMIIVTDSFTSFAVHADPYKPLFRAHLTISADSCFVTLISTVINILLYWRPAALYLFFPYSYCSSYNYQYTFLSLVINILSSNHHGFFIIVILYILQAQAYWTCSQLYELIVSTVLCIKSIS